MAIQQKSQGNVTLLAPETFIEQVNPSWFDPAHWQHQDAITGTAKGRGITYFIRYQQSDWVLRHYRRGGQIGRIIADKYLFPGVRNTRVFHELALLDTLYHGFALPCPKPIAGLIQRSGLFYRCDILIERIPQARDAHTHLCEHPLDNAIWVEIGRVIRRFHDKQIYHHDLNIHNILLDSDNKVWLIDFDKCGQRIGDTWKQDNLARLKRSLEKEQATLSGYCYQPANWLSLLSGYGK